VTGGLALFGGPRTATAPFPPWPRLSEKALTEAAAALASGRLGSHAGSRVAAFEQAWASWCGVPHAVAVSSGTAALHTALVAVGVGPGAEVILPSHTFASTALAVLQAGGIPVFCDVSEDQTLDPRRIEQLVTGSTRAVLVVHLYGVVADMGRIAEVARSRSLALVEDCAQATGAEWRGMPAVSASPSPST
jgi:dTDP-4-amino-4,6-dideoxygalactose transaminase